MFDPTRPPPTPPMQTFQHYQPSAEFLKSLDEMNALLSQMKEEIGRQGRQLAEAERRVITAEKEIEILLQNKNENERRLTRAEYNATRTSQISRKNQFVLKCPEIDTTDANFANVAAELLANKLRLSPQKLRRHKYEKLGKSSNSTVIVTVEVFNDRKEVFDAVRAVKPNRLSINPFLLPEKSKLLYEARQIKRNPDNINKIHRVFSFRGEIYIQYNRNGDRRLIRNISDIRV
jgi:hypothetical protein